MIARWEAQVVEPDGAFLGLESKQEDLFGGGSREDQSFIDVTNHNVEPMLAAGLLVPSPWFICGNPAIVSHALPVCFNSIGTRASHFNSFLVDWPNYGAIASGEVQAEEAYPKLFLER